MLIMRWLIVILAVALAVCLYLLFSLREKRAERRDQQARISAIYKRMYESAWVRQMVEDIEAKPDAFQSATVRPDGIIIPGVFHYAIDTGTTRQFDGLEIFVLAYIIYACLDRATYSPPVQNSDGSMSILPAIPPPQPKRDPY